jgi:hypothetical protein
VGCTIHLAPATDRAAAPDEKENLTAAAELENNSPSPSGTEMMWQPPVMQRSFSSRPSPSVSATNTALGPLFR